MFPVLVLGQGGTQKTNITTTELSSGIYRLFVDNSVSVTVQVGTDGVLVIDAAYDRTGADLKEAISNISNQGIKYLINTHLHSDHTGGNAFIGKGATIIAHPQVKEYLSNAQIKGETTVPPPPEYARPDITIVGKMTLDFNGETLEITHLPGGHTEGDLIIFFPTARVLIIGDLLFAGFFPYIDPSSGGNPLVYMKNVEWIIQHFADDVIFSGGHGPVFNKEELKNWHSELSTTIAIIQQAKNEGMNSEMIKSARLLQQWDSFGAFFINEARWIDILYPFL